MGWSLVPPGAGPPPAPRQYPRPGPAGPAAPHLRGAGRSRAGNQGGKSRSKCSLYPPKKNSRGSLWQPVGVKRRKTGREISSKSSLAVQACQGLISCGSALCACFPTTFGGDRTLARQSRRAAAPALPTLSTERCLRIPIPPEEGLRCRELSDLSPQVALLGTRVREDTSGTYPWSRGAPFAAHPPRAAQPRRCGERRAPHGHRAAAFPSVPVWEIAVFSLLTSGPEAQRGGSPAVPSAVGSGRGERPAGQADRAGSSALPVRRLRLPGGLGLLRVPRAGPLDL